MRKRAYVLGLLAIVTGCGERSAVKPKEGLPKPPRITHFYGNQAVVPKGESLTLCYGTEDVETLTLRPYDDGELRPSFNRCVSHTPAKDTTYVLTAKGPGGETTASFSVRVGAGAPKERVLIQSFQIVGNRPVTAGARAQLCYSTEGANAVSIQPRVEAALGVGKNQCFVVTPGKTTSYVLTATAADGSVDRMQVTVPVQ